MRNLLSSLLMICLCLLSLQRAEAQSQVNPYRYGSPYYWVTQSKLDSGVGKFDFAYDDLQKAEKGFRELGDVDSQLRTLEAMGKLKVGLGEWELANKHYNDALKMAVNRQDDFAQAVMIIDLLAFNMVAGNIRTYNYYQETLDSLYKKSNSAQLKTVYHTYWSNEFLARKEYAMADFHLQQCWDVMQDLSFSDREQMKLTYYSNIQTLKRLQKRYDDAIKYAKDYIEQTKIINGRNSDKQYQAYSGLIVLYTLNNDSISAFACLDSLESGVGHAYQDKTISTTFYNIKGCAYADFKKYEKAIECFDKAYSLLSDKRSEDSPVKYMSLLYKAQAYYMLQRYDDAFTVYSEYVDASKNKFGDDSGTYYQTLFTLANIEGSRGNKKEADNLFRKSMNGVLFNMKGAWRYSIPSQREQFWMEALNSISSMASFAVKYGIDSGELIETCYNALLFSKSLLLETEKSVVDIIRNEGTQEDLSRYRTLLALNNRLLALKGNYEYNKFEIDSLIVEQRNLEKRLSNTCQSYSDYDTYLDIDYKKVRDRLKENEVLLDFSDYLQDDSIRQYVAYIYDKKSEYPLLKKCFEHRQLDSLLDGAQSFTLYNYELLRDEATQLLWYPIKECIPEKSTVYYIPSGAIHGIALEALPLSDGTTLGQHYHFVRLTSARELLKDKSYGNLRKTATLYGGLNYNLSPEKMEEESKCYDLSELAWVMRSEYGSSGFEDLRKTKEEVEKIGRVLENNGYDVKIYSKSKGNAESFVALSGKAPSILHIATHGFYYTPEEAKDNDFLSGYTDAMSLSGLVFSGGNADWLGKKKADGVLGGVLTAKDIANLNLKGTDLAVLSACKTGQGKATFEGLYGLQRAFKKAGVNTIIMSLWSVDDKVTSEFMVAFYERLADDGNAWNKRKAFEEAREIIRKKYPDPYLWAAFVMLD